jgi:hypothetical protein
MDTEGTEIKEIIIPQASFVQMQELRKSDVIPEAAREQLNYGVVAMAKAAEANHFMDPARNYIQQVCREETSLRSAAERMRREAMTIEQEAMDPMSYPLSGYRHAATYQGIVAEGIRTHADAFEMAHIMQALARPENQSPKQQSELNARLHDLAENYKKTHFWAAGLDVEDKDKYTIFGDQSEDAKKGFMAVPNVRNKQDFRDAKEAVSDILGVMPVSGANQGGSSGSSQEESGLPFDDIPGGATGGGAGGNGGGGPEGPLPFDDSDDDDPNYGNNVNEFAGVERLSVERQREIAREILQEIEMSQSATYHVDNQTAVGRLRKLKVRVESGVNAEIDARLHLNDCFVEMRAAIPDARGLKPGEVFSDAVKRLQGRFLNGDDFDVLLHERRQNPNRERGKESMPGMAIGPAFIRLQETYRSGALPFEKAGIGDTSRTYESLIENLSRESGISMENARKSVELADKLLVATLEICVLNKGAKGNDSVSEAIYLEDYREGRATFGDRGPEITINDIVGLGTSFLRFADKIYDKNGKPDRTKGVLDPAAMKFQQVEKDQYAFYLGVAVPRYLNTKEWLTTTEWKTEDLGRDKIDSMYKTLKFVSGATEFSEAYRVAVEQNLRKARITATPGEFGLAFDLFRGAIYAALHDSRGQLDAVRAASLGWDYAKWDIVRKNLVDHKVKLKDDRTGQISYASVLTPQEMKWIERTLSTTANTSFVTFVMGSSGGGGRR